ncbi:hypothetical protein C8R45DRAFT_1108862 [Mycena sanguinolenta]|nr:hypothetical protein C8R45DRAFT_1108862 [Mycena sanguinolenta]
MAFSALPTELIQSISGHLELRDHLVLCRANSRIHSICVQWIYRIVIFDDPVLLLRCCKTIIGRLEAALSVWELKIDCLPIYALKSFYTTLRSATTRMENLRVIKIASPNLFRSISDMGFPRLTDCNIPLLLDNAESYSFLGRNPTIECAFIVPAPGQYILTNLQPIEPIRMPRLRQFFGPEIAACTLVPGAPVSIIAIGWGPHPPMGYSRGLTAAASSIAEIWDLTTMISSWDPALLRATTQHTPRIKLLKILAPHFSGLTPEKEVPPPMVSFTYTLTAFQNFLSAMEIALRSLTCLTSLTVSDSTPFDRIADVLESEFDRVRRWGDICPTLFHIGLSGAAMPWIGFKGLWLPAFCANDHPDSAECLKWFLKKIVISPELPSLYRLLAEEYAGVAGMEVLEEAVKRGEAVPAFEILRKEGGGTIISFPSDP